METVTRAGEHANDGARGIGIAATIDGVDQAILEVIGRKKGLQYRFRCLFSLCEYNTIAMRSSCQLDYDWCAPKVIE